MENWTLDFLPDEFVRYVYDGCMELGRRLAAEPELAGQIEDLIREGISRTPMEALDLEPGLAILTGPEIAQAVMGCLRFLETYDEVEDLSQVGFDDAVLRFLRYLVARYSPALKAIRRRNNHPLGWHKFGHAIVKMENGTTHVHVKLMRNDDEVILIEDDTESMLRLVNFLLKAVEGADDYENLDEGTIKEFTQRYHHLIGQVTEKGALRGPRTEH